MSVSVMLLLFHDYPYTGEDVVTLCWHHDATSVFCHCCDNIVIIVPVIALRGAWAGSVLLSAQR